MSVIQNNLLMTPEGYQISRSVRTRQSASAYFNRTAGVSPTSNQKGTFSFWIKRGLISYGTEQWLFSAGSGSLGCYFRTDDKLGIEYFGGSYLISTQVFRDPSAWYHIVFAIDSTQATSSNRAKMYVNGVQVTSFATEQYPTQNATFNWMASGQACYINQIYIGGRYFDGYHTEFNYIDGQQLTPSSFGETDAVTGVWKPKKYAGTYGTNGFYLNFSDNSAATAAAIGKDNSGNGNNWTPNNISVTSGVTYDSMLDTPTPYADGGNGRGNYAVLNTLDTGYNASTSEANLKVSTSSAGNASSASTIALTANTYWEVTIGSNTQVGLIWGRAKRIFDDSDVSLSVFANGATGSLINATRTLSATPSWSNGDTLGFAWNNSTRVLTLYQAGSATATMTMTTPATGDPFVAIVNYTSGSTMSSQVNFGQRPFAYTPPTGFKALNTQNLPDATIKKGNQYFDVSLWTGNGTASQTVTNSGSMQPDLVWLKARNDASNHRLGDSVRGVGKTLYSNATSAEATGAIWEIDAFNADGFTYSNDSYSYNFVGWQWKESVTAGFDIVTYTGNGSTQNVSHSLGVAPKMVIVKSRSAAQRWTVYHTSTSNAYIYLNETFAADTANAALRFGNNSAVVQPTSSVFTVGNSVDVNQNTTTYVAYLFSEVAGFSKFGSYTGNGSTDGPFVYTGFKVRWLLVKRTDTTAYWVLEDGARSAYNAVNAELYPNDSLAESTDGNGGFDFLSNGFKLRNSGSSNKNASGGTYIYAAFAENPFKNSLAR